MCTYIYIYIYIYIYTHTHTSWVFNRLRVRRLAGGGPGAAAEDQLAVKGPWRHFGGHCHRRVSSGMPGGRVAREVVRSGGAQDGKTSDHMSEYDQG